MKQILEKSYLLTPADHQRHLEIPFHLDQQYENMYLHFSYSPKLVEEKRALILIQEHLEKVIPEELMGVWGDATRYLPLENFITLSLDDNQQYVGARHYKDTTQDIVISENGSTKGFLKVPVAQGEWCIRMNMHCLQSEEVRLHVKVSVD